MSLSLAVIAAESDGIPNELINILAKESRPLAARMFLSIAVVVVVGRVFGWAFKRISLPAVLGEILAGIALGPSLLGLIDKDLPAKLFPLEIRPLMKIVAELGLVIFMFIVGLEIDPAVIRRSGKKAVTISISSIIVPFTLGAFVLAPALYDSHKNVTVPGEGVITVKKLAFDLFIGISMCVTAFPILARILTERRMFRIPLGMLLISAAAADDVMAFALLTFTLSVAGTGEDHLPIAVILVLLIGFVALLFLVVRPLMDRFIMEAYRREKKLRPDTLAILLGCVVASAYFSFKVMDSSLIGPFLLGTALPRRDIGHFFEEIAERVEGISVTLLLPVFFVVTGLGVDIRGLGADGIAPTLLILAVACLGKFAGAGLAAKLQGVSTRQSLAIGTMMNTRGLAELVILGIAREAHILDDQLYTMLVIMTVVTTVMAGPLLRLIYPDKWLDREIADADRARAGGARGYRVLVAVDDPEKAGRLVDIALGAIGPPERRQGPGEVLLTYLTPAAQGPSEMGAGLSGGLARLTASMGAMAELRRRVEGAGATATVTSRLSANPAEDLAVQAKSSAPDLIVVGWAPGSAESKSIAERLLQDATGVTVLVCGPAADSLASPLIGAGSGRDHDGVLELAARLALGRNTGLVLAAKGGGRAVTRTRRELEEIRLPVTEIDTVAPSEVDSQARRSSTANLLIAPVELADGRLGTGEVAIADGAASPLLLVRGIEREHQSLSNLLGLIPDPPKPLLFSGDTETSEGRKDH